MRAHRNDFRFYSTFFFPYFLLGVIVDAFAFCASKILCMFLEMAYPGQLMKSYYVYHDYCVVPIYFFVASISLTLEKFVMLPF